VTQDLTLHAKWIELDNHIAIDIIDGIATGKYTVLNTGESHLSYRAILAIYKDNQLVKLKAQNGTLAPEVHTSFQISEPLPEGRHEKAFLWAAETLKPLF